MTENQEPQGAETSGHAQETSGHAQEPNPLASGQLAETPQSNTRIADDPLAGKQPADDPLGGDPLTLDRRNPPRAPGR